MVQVKNKKVVAQQRKKLQINVFDYGESQIEGTNVVVSVAVATFVLKKEDRHQIVRLGDDANFRKCQIGLDCDPMLSAFVGVFDGHDGDTCAEYCKHGLLQHIIAEQAVSSVPTSLYSWLFSVDRANAPLALDPGSGSDINNDEEIDMERHFQTAFARAEQRFGNKMKPPTYDEVAEMKTVPLKVDPPTNYNPIISRMAASTSERHRGGTTACTLSLFTRKGEGSSRSVIPTAVVANTGDSRLLTDDGSGSHAFRQVTTDHRPDEPSEKRRLSPFLARGDITLHCSSGGRDVRVNPGGLAVSRTIGDISASKAVICTPEVINVPLKISAADNDKEQIQRFVLATDGLFDVLSNEQVGKAAAVKSKSKSTRTTATEAAEKVLKKCLSHGGKRDDVTVCVVDVSYIRQEGSIRECQSS